MQKEKMAIVTEKNKKMYSGIITAASFAVPFVLMLILCIRRNVTPFGDDTFLYLDMKRQYVDFYSYYRSVFTGNNDFLYSFSGALGQSMPGFTAYYLTSPLLIPFIFISRAQLPAAVTFLCILKISLAGLTSDMYIREHSSLPDSFSSVIFSTSFAMSAYMVSNMCNIMWLDPIIMLPVILIGIDRILKHRSPVLYILSLAFALFTNYYIAYMIIIFTVVYAACGIFISGPGQTPGGRKRSLAVYISGSAAACALPAFILLPAFMELRSSTKNSVKTGLMVTLGDLNPLDILTKLLSLAFDEDQIMNGLPHIFCGVFILVLAVLFYLNRSIPVYRKIRYAVMSGILLLSFSVAGIDIIWHAGTEPMGYQYRYAFLFVFVMISCAYESFCALGSAGIKQSGVEAGTAGTRQSGAEVGTAGIKQSGAEAGTAGIKQSGAEAGPAEAEQSGAEADRRKMMCAMTAAALAAVAGIIAYAACREMVFLDSRKLVYNLAAAGAAAVLILLWAAGRSRRIRKTALIMLAVLQAGDIMLNAYLIWSAESEQQMSVTEFRSFCADTEAALQAIPDTGDDMYRLENCTPRSENDSMQFGYSGITHYDSMNNAATLALLHSLGYEANTIFCNYDAGNTRLADSLLGIRYVLSNEGQGAPGVRFESDDIGGEPTHRVHVYTENDVLPMAVAFGADTSSAATGKTGAVTDISTADPFTMQSAFANELCGYDTGILRQAGVSVTVDSRIHVGRDGDAKTLVLPAGADAVKNGAGPDGTKNPDSSNAGNMVHYSVTPVISGRVYFYMTVPGNYMQNIELVYGGRSLGSYANDSDWAVVDLGAHEAGRTFGFDMILHDSETRIGRVMFVTEDTAALDRAYDSLKPGFAAVHKISSSHLRIEAPDAGSRLYLSLPYDPAWHASAGDRSLEIRNFGGLMYVSLDGVRNGQAGGVHVIDMRYIPEGLPAGMIISVVTAGIMLMVWLLHRKNMHMSNQQKR
jgi:uncharacterized membrane protein YfhO